MASGLQLSEDCFSLSEMVMGSRTPKLRFAVFKISDDKISALVREHFDLRPKGIVQMLDLLRPIYRNSAAYGHFGRSEPEFSWEHTDKAEALKSAA